MTYRELDEICAMIGLNNYTEDDEKCQRMKTESLIMQSAQRASGSHSRTPTSSARTANFCLTTKGSADANASFSTKK